jgi:hypothetical protein
LQSAKKSLEMRVPAPIQGLSPKGRASEIDNFGELNP